MARTPFELKGKRVFVAVHGGMVGGALVRRLGQEVSNCYGQARRGRFARSGRGGRLAVFLAAAKMSPTIRCVPNSSTKTS